jgi:hypothetical protein
MRKTYRVLASAIAVLVVIQAMAIVWSIAGLFAWIDTEGGSLDKSVIEGWDSEPPTFDGAIGHLIHVMSGTFLIPLLGLLLLIVSFFAKVPRGVALAAVVVVSIVVQYLAGTFAELGGATVGIIHGLNAFILFGVALAASKAAKDAGAVTPETQPAAM